MYMYSTFTNYNASRKVFELNLKNNMLVFMFYRVNKRQKTEESPEFLRQREHSPEPRRRKDARDRISGKSVALSTSSSSGGSDLRNKLKAIRRTPYDKPSSHARYQGVRVEVRDWCSKTFKVLWEWCLNSAYFYLQSMSIIVLMD